MAKTMFEPDPAAEQLFSDIVQELLGGTLAQQAPLAVITGGQPGSGKRALACKAQADVGGAVVIDARALQARHPLYRRLQLLSEQAASEFTLAQAGAWADALQAEVSKARRHLVIVQTSECSDSVLAQIKALRLAGYRIEFWALAVNPEISQQRVYLQYEHEKADSGYGHFVAKSAHDRAYAALPRTVEMLEQAGVVDRLRIFDRRLEELYRAEQDDQGIWRGTEL